MFVVGALAVGAQLAWLTPFIIDPSRTSWTAGPARADAVDALVRVVLLDRRHAWSCTCPTSTPKRCTGCRSPIRRRCARRRKLGPLNVDNYEYPPPFLLVPRILGLVTPDFWGFRRLWFALNFGLVVAHRRARGAASRRAARHARGVADAVCRRRAGDHRARSRPATRRCSMIAVSAAVDVLLRSTAPRPRRGAPRLRDRRQALSRRVRALPAAAARLARRGLDRRLRRGPDRRVTRRRRVGAVPRVPARDARAHERRGVLGLPQPGRDRQQRLRAGPGVQAGALGRAAHGLRRDAHRRLDLHARRRGGHRVARATRPARGA